MKIDIKFIDASDWQEQPWYSSGGTRAKKVLQKPDGTEYYFKCSEKKPAKEGKPAKEYKYEFWNEIIAYQLGKALGLNMLRYDIAVFGEEIGCLSPKMNITDDIQLIEVGRYMTALNENFIPENYASRKEYTFQLLEQTISHFKLSDYWEQLLQTILFDALIGNTDRHQENWAFFGTSTIMSKTYEDLKKEAETGKMSWLKRQFTRPIFDHKKKDLNIVGKHAQLMFTNVNSIAPIYDNGSSLARELTDERVELLLQNDLALEDYINKGFAELHWDKIKLNHFKLIENLVKTSYIETISKSAVFLSNWDESVVSMIFDDLDKDLPAKWNEYCIPVKRKMLIIKIISLRFKKLKDLLSDRI
ncbi:MAG: HipA domain-containing protein [Sphingobacteriales bacterium]|nr:HipA domain-containing protein [Sphingobacteriales bacterium]